LPTHVESFLAISSSLEVLTAPLFFSCNFNRYSTMASAPDPHLTPSSVANSAKKRLLMRILCSVTVAFLPLLSLAATLIRVNDIPLQVELAETAAERQRGLMWCTHLPDDHGMLFIQPEAAPAAFWMKNTYIPLDILYFDSDGQLIELFTNVPPCTTPECPIYASKTAVKYILEINAGSAQRLGLQPGAKLDLN